jgi:hypothetical protein
MNEVKIALKNADYKELKRKVELSEDKNLKNLFIYANVKESDKVTVIEFHRVKWYPEYYYVQFFKNFIEELEKDRKPYKFIRVGDKRYDTEELYSIGEQEDWSCDEAIYVSECIKTRI